MGDRDSRDWKGFVEPMIEEEINSCLFRSDGGHDLVAGLKISWCADFLPVATRGTAAKKSHWPKKHFSIDPTAIMDAFITADRTTMI